MFYMSFDLCFSELCIQFENRLKPFLSLKCFEFYKKQSFNFIHDNENSWNIHCISFKRVIWVQTK